MNLPPGTRLGHYEVTSGLGAGGMGEVYRARDTSLRRDVALKILPDAFSQDSDRLLRFQREAEALAALNHPNIAQIFGVVEANGLRAIAMELVEGDTLADRIGRGPIPRNEAIPIALQIADALEAAHERGIIHRDLKPANIKIRDDDVVKVLDFGLAKAVTPEPSPNGGVMQPTMTSPATHIGVILGTAAYMSPEQARGRPVDRRTDMWAFGCVLYEMLTGRRAFEGEDVTETLGRVLERAPDLARLPADTPSAILRLLRRCFEKTPRDRLPGAASARLELKDVLTPESDERAATPARMASWWLHPLPTAVVGGLIGAVATLLVFLDSPGPGRLVRYDVMLPPGFSYPDELNGVALTPDGTLIFAAEQAGERFLFRRAPEDVVATRLAGTENADGPFMYPGGDWVGFFTRDAVGSLKRVRPGGGAVQTVYDLRVEDGLRGLGGAVDDTGQVIFGSHSRGLFRLSALANDRRSDPLTTLDEQRGDPHRFPSLLPGGGLIFTIGGTPDANQFAVLPASGGKWQVIGRGTDARYAPTGHVVFWRDNNLWAMRFDVERLETVSEAVVVVEGVRTSQNGNVSYAWTTDGTLAYVPAGPPPARSLVWVTRTNQETPLRAEPGPYSRPELSAYERYILLTRLGYGGEDIYLHDIERGVTSPVSDEPYSEMSALFWPGRDRFVYATRRDGPFGLYSRALDGAGSIDRLAAGERGLPFDWTRDGRVIHQAGAGLSIYSVETGQSEALLAQEGVAYADAQVSPDGRWFAYQSSELGNLRQVFVRPLQAPYLPRMQVSTAGGTEPRWNPNGTEIFYRQGSAVMRVPVKTGATLAVTGAPEQLITGPYAPGYDVDSSGRRFLMIKEPPAVNLPQRIVVVLNWFEELNRLLPSR